MQSDVDFPVVEGDTAGDEEGAAWGGGAFVFVCSGVFGANEGVLTLEYSRRPTGGFAPVIADPVGYTEFGATAPGVLAGWLPRGYVRLQFTGTEVDVTSITAFIRPGSDVIKVERATD